MTQQLATQQESHMKELQALQMRFEQELAEEKVVATHLRQQVSTLTASHVKLNDELHAEKRANGDNIRQAEQLQSEYEQEIKSLKQQLQVQSEAHAILSAQYERNIASLQAQLAAVPSAEQSEITKLTEQLKQEQITRETTETSVSQLQTQLDELKISYESLQSQLPEQSTTIATLEQKLHDTGSELAQLQSTHSTEIAALKDQITEISSENLELKTQLLEEQKRMDEVQSGAAKLTQLLQSTVIELDAARSELKYPATRKKDDLVCC